MIARILLFWLVASPALGAELTWRDNSNNEDGFMIQERVGPASSGWNVVLVTEPNVTRVTYHPPFRKVKYCFRVIAFNDVGEAAPTQTKCVRIP